MRKRVLLVIGQLHRGGAEGQLVLLARGLAGSAFDPTVACLSEIAEPHATYLRDSGVPVAVIPRRGHGDLFRVRSLAALVGSSGADLAHSFLVGANAYAYAATRLAGLRRLVVSSRTTMPMPARSRRLVHRWVFGHAERIIANSETVRDFTAGYYGAPPSRIRVVRNGVDLEAYREAAGSRETVRAALGIARDALLVGTLGRLSREKNLELFVDLAAALSREIPGSRFVIAGEGPHRAAVERAVKAASLEGALRLAGAREDVPDFLSALDLFVLTSDTEGLPNAIMEAMAAGLPVVATDVGGVREVVTEGETGHLVPRGRLVPLLGAARSLLGDDALRRRMGEAGRRRIAVEFSAGRMVSATAAVYEEVFGAGA
jgi:glycosyltransferase involved in cell wall biosynthesis